MVTRLGSLADLSEIYRCGFEAMIAAVEENIAGFSSAGFSKPVDVELDQRGRVLLKVDRLALPMAMYLERVYNRIAELSKDPDQVRAVRRFIDRTHPIRILELSDPARIREISADMDDLLVALEVQDVAWAARNLRRQLERHLAQLPSVMQAQGRESAGGPAPPL